MHGHNITLFLRWSFPASHSRRVVLCLPVNVIVCIILSIVVCPRVVLYKGARAPGVGVASWDWAATILLTEVVGVGAGMTAVSPTVTIPAVAVLGAAGGEMANLVAGVAARPGLKVLWAISVDMAHMACYDFSSLYPLYTPISDCPFPNPHSYSTFRQPRHLLPTITLHFFITCRRGSPSLLSRTLTHYAYLLIFLSPISCTIPRPVVAGLSQAFLVFNLS